jgi:hypothetical protein
VGEATFRPLNRTRSLAPGARPGNAIPLGHRKREKVNASGGRHSDPCGRVTDGGIIWSQRLSIDQ